jgi:outer membrane murein-binding lipoprotein Lpp
MAKYTVMDFKNVAVSAAGLNVVKPPQLSFKVEFDLPKEIEKEAAKDPLLQQEFKDASRKILDSTVDMIEKKMKIFDKLFEGMIAKGVDDKDMEKQIKGLNEAVKNDMNVATIMAKDAVMAAWDDLCAKKKEWKKFKIKVGVTIFATIVGLAVSIAAMASSPWSGGAGAAFAIIGFIKAGSVLAQEIAKLAMDIDQARKVLEVNLKVVESAVNKPALNAVNEISAAVFQEFLGASQPSVKTCSTACDTLKAKYAKMVVDVHGLSKKVQAAIDGEAKLKKDFLAEAAKKLKDHPVKDKSGQLKKLEANFDAELEKIGGKIMTYIGKIHDLYKTIQDWAPTVSSLSKRVKELEIKDPKALKIFREALKACMLVTSIFDGNKGATDVANIGTGIVTAGGLYVYDKIAQKSLDGTVFDI